MKRLLPLLAISLSLGFGSTCAAQENFVLPDRALTPGAVVQSTAAAVCYRGYAESVRPPYDYAWRTFRAAIFAAYRIPHERWHLYTIDHLVPLEIGGAPMDARNVWPQPKDEAKRKDEVEDALHAAVCYTHTISIADAQAAIARDWTATPVGLPPLREHHYGNAEASQ
jgi:hypothetical protein